MNHIDDLNVNRLTTVAISTQHATISSGTITATSPTFVLTGDVYFGTHHFKADQLGQLFNLLISQYPELSL